MSQKKREKQEYSHAPVMDVHSLQSDHWYYYKQDLYNKMSDYKDSKEYYLANAEVIRDGNKATIRLDEDREMVATNIPDMTDFELLEDAWEVFSIMNDPESTKQLEELSEEGYKSYVNEVIEDYDDHSFITIRYDYDEKVAREEYDKDVAEGLDQTYDEWIDDRKFQALEFETVMKE